jgi:hypothetical protein
MAYTKEPSGDEDGPSAVVVVRNSSKFGPLFVSWRWILVCGARGIGNDTSMGACDTSPLVKVIAIGCGKLERRGDGERLRSNPRGKLAKAPLGETSVLNGYYRS